MTKKCECGCFLPVRCHHCDRPLPGMSNDDLALRLAEAECKARGETIERYRVALAAMQFRENQAAGLIDWFVQECGGPYTATCLFAAALIAWTISWTLAGLAWGAW